MYTSCVLPYCAVWSTYHAVPICHMTHYITVLVAITVWKTNSQEIFPNAAGALKNTSPVLFGKCTHLAIGTPVFQVCII